MRCSISVLQVPTVGTHSWKRVKQETTALEDPMTLEESLQIRNNRINISVSVSGIYRHSKTSKCMVMYNLPSSRGTMTRALTLEVPKIRQHDTSLQSVLPNHQDYVSTDDHKTFLSHTNPRDVPQRWVITIQTRPVWPGTDGRWIRHNEQGRKGSRKCHLPRRPRCSPLPNPSPCIQTLGPWTSDRHLTETTICSSSIRKDAKNGCIPEMGRNMLCPFAVLVSCEYWGTAFW